MLATHLIAATLATSSQTAAPPARPEPYPIATWANAQPGPHVAFADPSASAPSQAEPTGASASAQPPPAEDGPQSAPPDEYDLELEESGLTKDPIEGFNRVSFDVSQALDKILIRPAAMAYRHVVPKPVRDGARNALSNIGEPLVFLNDFLQLRPDRMAKTLGRFLINSTLGLGGLFDIARRKPFDLAHHDNSFGDTLGYYGVGPGPYIYLPIIGPTTLRDALGSSEQLIPPLAVGKPFDRMDYVVATTLVDGLDQRERADDDLRAMLAGAIDPYATFRANYLQDRAGEINSLKAREGEQPAVDAFDDPLIDPAQAAPSAEAETRPRAQ